MTCTALRCGLDEGLMYRARLPLWEVLVEVVHREQRNDGGRSDY